MYAVSIPNSPDVSELQHQFHCSRDTALSIFSTLRSVLKRGEMGAKPFVDCHGHDWVAFQAEANSPVYRGVDVKMLAKLWEDGWINEITHTPRLVLALDSLVCDSKCLTCGADTLENGAEECCGCGSTNIKHFVSVSVEGPFARLWAEADKTIEGEPWISEGDGFAEAIIADREDLTEDLADYGYTLNTENY